MRLHETCRRQGSFEADVMVQRYNGHLLINNEWCHVKLQVQVQTAPGKGCGSGTGSFEAEVMVQRQEHLLMGGLVQPSDYVIQMV